ncbi:uncharacterized protein LOC131619359 [Vicia villosa]|uniref:uncharacterized protein LOC131619359 n=1 Tax=Vicia villosa TaxID=3911 RepID=UPI00273B672F|nr:uncharacterized protein LOC131619359 [Vicia villosa]
MASPSIDDLSLQEEDDEGGFCFDVEEEGSEAGDLRLCLVGRFLCDKPIHVMSMKKRVADMWRPVKGVIIKQALEGLFLFQFSHKLDMEAALKGGSWTFGSHLLIIDRVQIGIQLEHIPIFHVEFWVQIHNLPAGFMLEKVGKTMANYIGTFVEYDKNNNSSFWRQYMRLRVKVDVRQPLKKNTRVKNKGGDWCTVNFKYENLGLLCFVCGLLGHSEQKCEIRFEMEEDNGLRGWTNDLRVDNRRVYNASNSKWLKEEGAGSESTKKMAEEQGARAHHEHADGLASTGSPAGTHQDLTIMGEIIAGSSANHGNLMRCQTSFQGIKSPEALLNNMLSVPPAIMGDNQTTKSLALNGAVPPLPKQIAPDFLPHINTFQTDNPTGPPSLIQPIKNPQMPNMFNSFTLQQDNLVFSQSSQVNMPKNNSLLPMQKNTTLNTRPHKFKPKSTISKHISSNQTAQHSPHIPRQMNFVLQTASVEVTDSEDGEVQLERKRRREQVSTVATSSTVTVEASQTFLSAETLSKKQKLESIRVLLKFDSCLSVDVVGRSGGLAVLWKESANCRILNYSRNYVNLLVEDEVKGAWRLTCYYGYPERSRRREAWDMLRDLRELSSVPWCVIGDFNDLLSQRDKVGLHQHPNWLCAGFREAVTDCSLLDLPLEGHPFTWIKSRDHSPILLHCDPSQRILRNKYRFRFENEWLKDEELSDVVNQSWNAVDNGEVLYRISNCAKELSTWNKAKYKQKSHNLSLYMAAMEAARLANDEGASSRFFEAQKEYNKILIREEIFWKQRAKMHWLRHGDSNSKFFHKSATLRKNFKKIDMLVDDTGAVARDQEGLCRIAISYFKDLFEAKQGEYDPVLSCIQPIVTQEDNCRLLSQITKAELYEALIQMHPDKSPGPDGFNPAFYQHFWSLCSDDIFQAASLWLSRGYFPVELNETNICLIPKCAKPKDMKELRPISLCNVVYKLIAKLLANRLKVVLDKCVSEEQSAFVEGRSILDNAMVATEIIHALKRKASGNRANLALKIDISKAYDKVDWGFLRGILLRLGFDERWTHWLMMCVTSVHYSVLVNSDRVGPIFPGRGLRQGDPLSPYLFILVATIAEVSNLMVILNTYAEATGQVINLAKSEVFFSRNLSVSAQEDLANVMGVRRVLGTGTYLGLPSMIGRSKKAVFSFIKDRIWKRINSWSGRYLSKAGKEVMIKSVLQSIPSYIMSVYLIPDGVVNDIEKMINSFWWGGGSQNNKGIRWLAWDRMTMQKSEGGMGFRDFKAFNMAMVAKQGWYIMANPTSLVARIFKAKYFPNSSFFDSKIGNNPSFVWRSLWKAKAVLQLGSR